MKGKASHGWALEYCLSDKKGGLFSSEEDSGHAGQGQPVHTCPYCVHWLCPICVHRTVLSSVQKCREKAGLPLFSPRMELYLDFIFIPASFLATFTIMVKRLLVGDLNRIRPVSREQACNTVRERIPPAMVRRITFPKPGYPAIWSAFFRVAESGLSPHSDGH